MKMTWRIPIVLVGCISLCGYATSATSQSESGPAAVTQQIASSPYPRGRWRLMTPGQLGKVVLWPSHILIRHRDITDTAVAFRPSIWRSSAPTPTRSREQAYSLAKDLSATLRVHPDRFAELAATHSEDLATRSEEGSLGGVPAIAFLRSPEVLDALAEIEPRAVSQPVESRYGFHILMRRDAPEPSWVSGAHLVIGYDDAGWLRLICARGNVPRRSRDEAIALAQGLYERLRRHPETFPAMVAQYSEHTDASVGGDLGMWQTRGMTNYPREIEILARLAEGEISRPIDSPFGIEILQRTANRPRARYAMRTLIVQFDPRLPDDQSGSRASALRQATSLREAVSKEPARFESLHAEHGWGGRYEFEEGPDYPEVARALVKMKFGEISDRVIESYNAFFIPQRLEPAPRKVPDLRFDLELQGPPDVDYFLGALNPTVMSGLLAKANEKAALSPHFTSAQVSALRSSHAGLSSLLNAGSQERGKEVRHTLMNLLGSAGYERYRELLEQPIEEALLTGR